MVKNIILTQEQINNIKKRHMEICKRMDYLDNHFELLEIYDEINEEKDPDYFKTHKTIEQKIDIEEKKLYLLGKYANEKGFNLRDG